MITSGQSSVLLPSSMTKLFSVGDVISRTPSIMQQFLRTRLFFSEPDVIAWNSNVQSVSSRSSKFGHPDLTCSEKRASRHTLLRCSFLRRQDLVELKP